MVDKVSDCKQVSHLFLEKCKTIYTSVLTLDKDMAHFTNEISNRISNTDCNSNVTPDIINDCIAMLKRDKSDGNIGFSSNHYINGNSNVYCCLLDVSKAFDEINSGKLFSTLQQVT